MAGHTRQQGVALLQVLLLGAILSLLVIQITHTARAQVELVRNLEARLHIDLFLRGLDAEFLIDQLSDPGTQIGEPLSHLAWQEPNGRRSEGISATTQIMDVGGLLPLQFPTHPLWPPVLRSLGMSDSEIGYFLSLLRDLQDFDEIMPSGEREALRAESGYRYPNSPVQLPTHLTTWLGNDQTINGWLSDILAVSHPYPRYEVSVLGSPEQIKSQVMGEYGVQILGSELTAGNVVKLGEELELRYQGLVVTGRSPIWRVTTDVSMEEVQISRSVDYLLQPNNEPPFTILDR